MRVRPPAVSASIPAEGAAAAARAAVFEAVVLVHLDAAYTLARYLTRRGDAAEDIVQDALLRAYRGFHTMRGSPRAWLLAIVRNCFLSWNASDPNRRRAQIADASLGLGGLDRLDAEEPDQSTPEALLLREEQNAAIRAAIERLPELFREVLVLRDIEDMSYREIAEVVGVPIGTVMSRLARARKLFAAAWSSEEAAAPKVMQR